MELTLEAEEMDAIQWWIDAIYGMHPDLKGHSGGMMPLGKGAEASKLRQHMINLRSSTDSEIIRVDDHMTGALCTLRFLGVRFSR